MDTDLWLDGGRHEILRSFSPPLLELFLSFFLPSSTMATGTATTTATATATSAVKVSPQGGILEGGNPTHYDSKNPLVLFIIQVWIPLELYLTHPGTPHRPVMTDHASARL